MNSLEFIKREINDCKLEIDKCTMKYNYGILYEFCYKQDVEKYYTLKNALEVEEDE